MPPLAVCEAGEAEIEKSVVPVPCSATVWGLPVASSAIVRAPSLDPGAVGKKAIEITHACPGGTLPPHVLPVVEKSPLAVMLLIVRAPFPVLVNVTL